MSVRHEARGGLRKTVPAIRHFVADIWHVKLRVVVAVVVVVVGEGEGWSEAAPRTHVLPQACAMRTRDLACIKSSRQIM